MSKIAVWFEHERVLYFFAFTASILLSFWLGYRETVINPDGICYLLSAQMVGVATLTDVMHLCPQSQWPFYSILIHVFVQISHLSYMAAAYLLDGFFSLVSIVTFILIVKELGGSRRVLWLAAFVILLNHQLNSVREYIIRDHGFWAFYLVSIFFMLRYFRKPKWVVAIIWNASLLLATLFRIEGAIFLFVMPFLSWFYFRYPKRTRAKFFFALNLPTIFVCVIIAIWFLVHPQQTVAKLGRISEIINQLQHGLSMLSYRYQTSKMALAQYVLTPDSMGDAGEVLFLVWISWYVLNVMGTLSAIYAILVIYAWWHKIASFSSRVIYGYLGVNVIVTLGFLAERLFLSKRYLIALTLVLMLWVPFALDDLIKKWQNKRHAIALAMAVFFIFISSLGGMIDFGYSKSYIHDAGDWIAKNIPANAALYANDFQLMFYSQHFGNRIFEKLPRYVQINTIAHDQWKQYDYLALRVGKREVGDMDAVLQEINLIPIQVFSNKRGDRVAIYKVGS